MAETFLLIPTLLPKIAPLFHSVFAAVAAVNDIIRRVDVAVNEVV